MITILPTKTPAELRLLEIDEQLRLVENYARGAAHTLNSAMDIFWNTEDELLLEILNKKGPEAMGEIFTAHAHNATNINALLGERGIEPIAVIGMRKPIKVNEFGIFEMDYPVIEEPEPEPEPEPDVVIPTSPYLAAVGKGSGWLPEPEDTRDFPLAKLVLASPALPPRHTLGDQSPVRDQQSVGSCTGFASTAAVDYLRRVPTEDHWETIYSPLFTYYNARVPIGMTDTDSGAYIRDAIKSLANIGAARESDCLYYQAETAFRTKPTERAYLSAEDWKIGGYYRCNGLADVRKAIAAGFPVVGGFNCYSNLWQSNDSGVIPLPDGTITGGHAVLFMGYDDATRLVKFKNSWGTGWGDQGYGYLPYDYFDRGLASDLWALQGESEATR